ncbi:serine/threonine-protein kinase edr1 [Phtheirospermum japonicum]|uniref:Serine/threonine-protein kinase edr1 n=1 Tax=Phtheirospermum japonicum TaxID=374723 RepID=A0A830CKV9_9LAMI|nr:serine/threonine-protein kinase edr1 [Phtheirospermum japonicum]
MESELSGRSGRQTDADSPSVMPNDQKDEYKNMRNISVQTGEEFSPEFLKDCLSKRTPFANDINQMPMSKPGHDAIQNHHYKDPTGFQGTRRNDSENCTEFSDFGPGKGYGFDVDKAYLDGASTYHRELQAITLHQRKLSTDFDKGSPSAISVCSSDSPNYSKGIGNLDRTFSGKMKFLCSFGGRILPRPNDGKLRYAGGDTRIISITKDLTYNELVQKTMTICNYHHTVKYQLPGEDLDALISVSSDEDLHHMIDEYHDLERKSQRLRIFLVSCGDLEGSSSSETRGKQKSDAEYQYVVAVNGMSPHRSSSRESLESPTVQKEPVNTFCHLENQNGGSSLNLKLMLSGPSSQLRTYENVVTCPYVYKSNCPYVVDTPGYDSPGFNEHVLVQSQAQPIVGSHFRKPSNEFQSPLPHSPSYSEARSGFLDAVPLHSEKLVPSQDTFSFSPMSDFNANSCKRVNGILIESRPANQERILSLEHESEKTVLPFAHEKYQILGHKDQPFQESLCLNTDYTEWGKDAINWMKNKEISFDHDRRNDDIVNDYASNAEFLKQKQNLPQIIYQPESNPIENPTELWKALPGNYQISPNEPKFLIKSQKAESGLKHDVPNAIDSNTTFFGLQSVGGKENNNQSKFIDPVQLPETTTDDALGGGSDGNVKKEKSDRMKKEKSDRNSLEEVNINNGTFVNSQSLYNFHGTRVPEKPIIDEQCDGIESPGDEAEAESFAYASENDDKVDDDNKDETISDAAVIEMEASIYGLQIIKNTDLEELQELGSGTFGTVYHGKWRGTDVAIKRIKKSCFAGGSSEQERLTKDFWREAKILSKLHHPNIVAFYGVVPDGPGGTLATVSEYMANGSLRRVLLRKDRALDRRKKVIIALDASFGMEYLHLKNIVHFDLKCDNLLINLGDSQRPVCKVTDFGLSRIKQNTLVSGGVRGTLPWMAPELLNGNSSRVSEKVDVFSFGIAMWEILTGEEPYIDMHCGAIIGILGFCPVWELLGPIMCWRMSTYGGIVNNTLRPLIPERCDPEWRKLMEECWSHDPAERPSFTEITKKLQTMSTMLQPKRLTNRVRR